MFAFAGRFALLLGLLFCGDVLCDEQVVRRPLVVPGDTWTYRTITDTVGTGRQDATVEYTVTFANDSTIIGTALQTLEGKKTESDRTWTSHWNTVTSTMAGFARESNKLVFAPHSGALKFPLKAGDEFKAAFEVSAATATSSRLVFRINRTVKAAGWREIAVPAGRFTVLLIESDGTQYSAESGRTIQTRTTIWYSPQVRRWVKFLIENVTARIDSELVSYKLAD